MSLDFTFLCKMKGLPSKVFLKLNVVKGQSVLSLFFFLFFFSFLHFISFSKCCRPIFSSTLYK